MDEIHHKLTEDAELTAAIAEARNSEPSDEERKVMEKFGEDVELVLCGTGASATSKYRNVTGYYLRTVDGGVLLDCGEGTYGQLATRYGDAAMYELVRTLRFVFISHIHADHHVGLIRVLMERTRVLISISATVSMLMHSCR